MFIKEEQTLLTVKIDQLLDEVQKMQTDGYRLVQIGTTAIPNAYELNYSFDKDYHFINLRLTVSQSDEIPSITPVFWNAFIYENEIHDLFGLSIIGISVDYKGNFYKLAVKTPFQNPTASKMSEV